MGRVDMAKSSVVVSEKTETKENYLHECKDNKASNVIKKGSIAVLATLFLFTSCKVPVDSAYGERVVCYTPSGSPIEHKGFLSHYLGTGGTTVHYNKNQIYAYSPSFPCVYSKLEVKQ
jgi:hypothetical protein